MRAGREDGNIQQAVAVVLCLGATLVGVVALTTIKYNTTNYGTYAAGAPLAPAAAPTFIGPALSSDPGIASCQRKKAEGHGATWAGDQLGWRAEKVWPDPTNDTSEANIDPVVLRGRVRAWTDGMNGLMAIVKAEWAECPGGASAAPPAAPARPKPVVTGTYDTEFVGQNCGTAFTFTDLKQIGVTQGPPFTIDLTTKGQTIHATGTLTESDLTFSAEAQQDVTDGFGLGQGQARGSVIFTFRIAGRFDLDLDDRTIIREGRGETTLTFDGKDPIGCTFSYTAKRPS